MKCVVFGRRRKSGNPTSIRNCDYLPIGCAHRSNFFPITRPLSWREFSNRRCQRPNFSKSPFTYYSSSAALVSRYAHPRLYLLSPLVNTHARTCHGAIVSCGFLEDDSYQNGGGARAWWDRGRKRGRREGERGARQAYVDTCTRLNTYV